MNFTLDDIRSAADAKYSHTDIKVGEVNCRLLNPLRLSKERREQLIATQDRLGDESADQAAVLREALRIVCESTYAADTLLGALGDDLAMLVTVFEKYSGATQAGEASASAA